ncbi:hypothetical protein QKU94_gp4 [Arlivirus sp. virus]|uniref:Nucleoprotein n=1 Tax=Arlivirus sp. virus TaxID=2809160 RepID=A0AAX1PEX4_9MONO|nr:hypothetical protein QKU94_gp4 [Arlivirus sp. virus]QXV86528.1 hypothetical protein [Arlivirus sp. virus]
MTTPRPHYETFNTKFRLLTIARDAKEKNKRSTPLSDDLNSINNLNQPQVRLLPKVAFSIFSCHTDVLDDLAMAKCLLLLATTEGELSPLLAGHVWVNTHLYLFPGTKTDVIQMLKRYDYEVYEDQDIFDWVDNSGAFDDVDIRDHEELTQLTRDHVLALIGMYECFMGRHLTTANYAVWIARRMIAFASALGCDQKNTAYEYLQPSQVFCSGAYVFLASKKPLRTIFFKDVQGSKNNPAHIQVANTMRTALVYLQGSEMAMFILIYKYILCENPILLAWNELAKHTDKLIAAYDKWIKLGQMAPYCKLFCAEAEVEEFNRRNLSIFCDIAVAIAKNEGTTSLQNYRGTMDNDQTSPIIKQALTIVNLYGGAQTYVTNAMDHGLLIEENNEELRRQLHRGGLITDPPPSGQSTSDPIQFPSHPFIVDS